MGLSRLTLGLEPGPSGGQDRPVGGEGRTVTIQKRWGRPSALCLGPPRKKQVGKGRKAGWDEALLNSWGKMLFLFPPFQIKSLPHSEGSLSHKLLSLPGFTFGVICLQDWRNECACLPPPSSLPRAGCWLCLPVGRVLCPARGIGPEGDCFRELLVR